MRTARPTVLFLATLLAACGTGSKTDTAAADSALQRDQTLLPADSVNPIGDTATVAPTPAPAPEPAPAPVAAAPRPTPKPAPKPVAPRPAPAAAAPAAPARRALAAGTAFATLSTVRISSRTNKAGEEFEVRLAEAVTDAAGRVVIPAGSRLTLGIARIKESENKSDNTGVLELTVKDVIIDGQSYPISASVTSKETVLEGRKTNAGDVAKVGAGAAAGAIVGKVLGGGKGAVIGGVVGGAVGTQRAVETKDRDVVLNEGATVRITLDADFVRS